MSSASSAGKREDSFCSVTFSSLLQQSTSWPPGEMNPGRQIMISQGQQDAEEPIGIPGINAPFTTTDLVCWGWQVANGMDYLTSKKVLHGDLAARNLLLSHNNVIKIGDFGLSRNLYMGFYTKENKEDLLPFKWLSIEAIKDMMFSPASDIWSYGVTLWELFSLAAVPYYDVEDTRQLVEMLENGHRLQKPKCANEQLYRLMRRCWDANPIARPNFQDAASDLFHLLNPVNTKETHGGDRTYLPMNCGKSFTNNIQNQSLA